MALTDFYRTKKGKEVLFLVEQNAFKQEDPDAPDIFETQVTIPPVPRLRTGVQLLRLALDQVPTKNATFLMRPGHVEITTHECTTAGALLSESIQVRIQRRPLHLVLEDLFEETGVPIVLDGRVGNLARMHNGRLARLLVSAEGRPPAFSRMRLHVCVCRAMQSIFPAFLSFGMPCRNHHAKTESWRSGPRLNLNSCNNAALHRPTSTPPPCRLAEWFQKVPFVCS